ncbi:MAG: hypothetical protein IKI59_04695 [Clostridia bacterium]|nr:hypothetical protein [Clostridia bacterium]
MKKETQTMDREKLSERAYALFFSFRSAYANEWRRLEHCERMYRGEHWYDVPVQDPNEPRPVTPILQSTVENITADLMDQIPEAIIRPESAADMDIARIVEAVILRNHDAAAYPEEYRKLVHDLLVAGYCVQEVGYDPGLNGHLGGAFVRQVDVRNILFDPLCSDIQDSRAIFKLSLRSKEWLKAHYPDKAALLQGDIAAVADAPEDDVLRADRADSMLVLEYWWREYDADTDTHRVHMAILCGGQVLEDSRTQKPEGYFAHGEYPFVLTPLYPRKGSALGFGVIDLFGEQQRYADKLDQIVLKNALMASRNKLLLTDASGFDEADLRDWSKEVHVGESLSGITWFSTPPLPQYLINYIRSIREDIKEESGANDSSRGTVPGGVTAARAIEALQEASTKRARMATTQLHEAFRKAVRMEIEVEREFNFYLRPVTVVIDGEQREVLFDSAAMNRKAPGGVELPIEFSVSIKAARRSRFVSETHNELMLKLIELGALTPEQAIEQMTFEGKEQVLKSIRSAQGENIPTEKPKKEKRNAV